MKKIIALIVVSMVVMAFPAMSLARRQPFKNLSSAGFDGNLRTAVVQVTTTVRNGRLHKRTFVKKNRGGKRNLFIGFSNMSGMEISGSITFDDGLWLNFSGPIFLPSSNRFMGNVPASGAVRLDGNVVFDPNTQTFTGDGTAVTFDGNVNIKGLINSNGGRGMMKVFVNPSNEQLVTFTNNSSSAPQPALLGIKFPAMQMNRTR